MKKPLLLGLLLAAGLSANAQIADGSIAVDFTATDVVNQQEYSLYADYLDNGKSVILDFSATWCAPCWNYHQSHAMADLYEAYGPNGSDEVGVFFIEGDIQNTVTANLYGEQVAGKAPTRGNWVAGSPYPIIEDNATMNLGADNKYKVEYFPQMYRICKETKTTKVVDQQTALQLRNSIQECQTLTGIANHGKIEGGSKITICASGETQNVVAKLKNFGNNNVTAAHVVLKKDNAIIAEQDYTGNLAQFATPASITFSNVTLDLGATYKVELTSLNGGAAANADLTVATVDFGYPTAAENNYLRVDVFTDNKPTEITWEIKDEAGLVVASGGPYTAADADKRMTSWVSIPGTTPQCHTVVMKDSGNNGWNSGNSELGHGMIIYSNNQQVFLQAVANFGASTSFNKAFRTNGVLENEKFVDASFAMFPNPTTGIVNFTTQETLNVTVVDMTGKTVHTAKDIKDGDSINLSTLQSGIYIAKIKGEKSQRVEKIIIK